MKDYDESPLSLEETEILYCISREQGKNLWWSFEGLALNRASIRCTICEQFVDYWDSDKNECKSLNAHMRKHLKLITFL